MNEVTPVSNIPALSIALDMILSGQDTEMYYGQSSDCCAERLAYVLRGQKYPCEMGSAMSGVVQRTRVSTTMDLHLSG